jgi:hypothetical protein
MDKMDLILEDIYFETHTVDVRRKPVRLVVCLDGKNVTLKFIMILMAGGSKLKFGLDRPNEQ